KNDSAADRMNLHNRSTLRAQPGEFFFESSSCESSRRWFQASAAGPVRGTSMENGSVKAKIFHLDARVLARCTANAGAQSTAQGQYKSRGCPVHCPPTPRSG